MLIPAYYVSNPPPVTDPGLGGGSPAIYSAPPPRTTGLGGLDELIERTRQIANETIETARGIEEEIADIIRDSGYGIRVITSGCTTTIEHIPRAGSGEAPHVYISYVNPACREEPPPPPADPPGSPTSGFPSNIAGTTIVYAFVSFNGTREYFRKSIDDLLPTTYTTTYFATWSDFKCPGVPFNVGSGGGLLISPQVTGTCTYGASNTGTESTGEPINSRGEDKVFQFFASSFSRSISLQNGRLIRSGCFNLGPTPNGLGGFDILYGRYDDIKQYCTEISQGYNLSYNHTDLQLTITESRSATIALDFLFDATCTPLKKPPQPPPSNRRPPPPPQPPPRRCCMGCCPSNVNNSNNDALLRQILALLQKVDKNLGQPPFTVDIFDADENKPEAQKKTESIPSIMEGLKIGIREGQKQLKIMGIDAFPIKAKANSVVPEKSGIWTKIFGFIDPEEKVDIRSIADVLLWQEKRRLGEMGQWMQTIEVADADLTKEGDQYKKVVLPNVAESLKEVVMQNALNARTQGLVLDVVLKILVEVCSTKMVSSQGTTILKDIQEYLDYTTQEKTFQVPIGISIPGKDLTAEDEADLGRFLEPSNQPFVSAEWDGKMSFSDTLLDILQAVSIIRAMGFKQT